MTAIVPYLTDGSAVFAPEATHAISVAFDEVCRALYVPDNAKLVRESIASKVIEHARRGERDPDRLRDSVLRQIGGDRLVPPPRQSAAASRTGKL